MRNKIIFEDIYIEGFGSIIKPLIYKLDSPGINIILGKNGSGKTTILSALCWAAYNQTLKTKNRIEPWKSRIPKDFKGTMVVLSFKEDSNKYQVINCKGYKNEIFGAKGADRMLLIENGKHREDLRDKNDVKKEVVKILGKSFDLFKNSIVFGQKLKRIISEDGPKKKEIFEEAFEVGYINRAKKFGEEDLLILSQEHTELDFNINHYQSSIQAEKNLIKYLKANLKSNRIHRQDFIKRIKEQKVQLGFDKFAKEKIIPLEKELQKINDERVKITNKINPLLLKEKEHFKLDMGLVTLQTDYNQMRFERRDLFTSKLLLKCPACGQDFKDKEAKQEHRKKELKNLHDKIKIKSKNLMMQREKMEAYKNSLIKLEHYKMLLKDLDGRIREINNQIISLKSSPEKIKKLKQSINEDRKALKKIDIAILKSKLTKSQDKITRYQLRMDPKILELDKLNKRIENYKWAINEPLSNSGIKAYIFNQMLGLVNKRLLYYSEYTDFVIKFGIDLESARKDFKTTIFEGTEEIDYSELSGGQQQLVDVALAFSIHDVISEDNDCNIFMMDEVFESLDEDNVELITELIKSKAANKSIHIITHLKDFVVANSNCIRVKLDKHKRTIIAA